MNGNSVSAFVKFIMLLRKIFNPPTLIGHIKRENSPVAKYAEVLKGIVDVEIRGTYFLVQAQASSQTAFVVVVHIACTQADCVMGFQLSDDFHFFFEVARVPRFKAANERIGFVFMAQMRPRVHR